MHLLRVQIDLLVKFNLRPHPHQPLSYKLILLTLLRRMVHSKFLHVSIICILLLLLSSFHLIIYRFIAALKAANLVDTLKGPGPFTVLAPSDDAFAKLPVGDMYMSICISIYMLTCM